MKLKQILFVIYFLFLLNNVHAQTRLVLNGGIVNIVNGGILVIDNSANNALTRNSGHILSEGENNKIKWNIGTTTGTYTIPTGYSTTDFIPVTFTKTAGSGAGSFSFSTYRTSNWQNSSSLPTGVSNVNNASGSDNSEFVIDRFWMIDADGYTSKPDLTNLIFTYTDAEHSIASNTIAEANLQAQRWNSVITDWGGFGPAGTVNTAANTVTVSSVPAADFFPWWTLVDKSSPLPVEIVDFNYKCQDGQFKLLWSTASETNNDYFTLERSADASIWEVINTIKGNGNSNQIIHYATTDLSPLIETNYYRLKQTDFDGNYKYSKLIAVHCTEEEKPGIITIYPNPTAGEIYLQLMNLNEDATTIQVCNMLGELVYNEIIYKSTQNEIHFINLSYLDNGIYFVKTLNNKAGNAIKISITK